MTISRATWQRPRALLNRKFFVNGGREAFTAGFFALAFLFSHVFTLARNVGRILRGQAGIIATANYSKNMPSPPIGSNDNQRVQLRRPTAADWPAILEVLRTANYHHIGGQEMATFPLEDCFLAEVAHELVGVAGYRILDATTAKTTLMAVPPAWRKAGIGRLLQTARMNYLRSQGIRELYTNCDDEQTIAWYEKHFGYQRTGQRVPKLEPFGLLDKDEWITLKCDLDSWDPHS